MTFVLADLHGDLEKFHAMLEKIRFSDDDVLYVLGDSADYGTKTMELLIDMSMRANVYPIAGEHDFTALRMLSGFEKTIANGAVPTPEFTAEMTAWVADGGKATLDGFRTLSADMREGIIDYLSEFSLFEEVTAGGGRYVLVHAGIGHFDPAAPLESYAPGDFFVPAGEEQTFFSDKTLVVGHTPTDGKIRRENGVIRIDCGVRENGVLGCLCLESGEEFYV